MAKQIAIIPTYNEAENIRGLLKCLIETYSDLELLIVDDNSPDGTGSIVKQWQKTDPRIHLLARAGKDGLAAAYLAGFDWALKRKFDCILQMDADFSHNPKDVGRLLAVLSRADVAVGCRYTEGGDTIGWSPARRFISRGGNFYARRILGLHYRDLTGGFNAWKREVLESIQLSTIRSRGYAFQVELKYRAGRAGFSLEEVPIHFENRRFGTSKMSGDIVWEAAFRVFQMRFSG